jgi:hypothetical protein
MLRRVVLVLAVSFLSGCGSQYAPPYSMQVTNITPQNSGAGSSTSSTTNTSSTTASSTAGPSSLLFQFWKSTQTDMTFNLVPLSESLSTQITYDTSNGDQCVGNVVFNQTGTSMTLSVDSGPESCTALNGIYYITVSENYLTLFNSSGTLYFVNS